MIARLQAAMLGPTRWRPGMRRFTTHALVLGTMGLAWAQPASAQNADSDSSTICDNYKTPAQVLGGLTSDKSATALEAKTCGLQSDDRSVRAVVLQQLLRGVATMSFNIEPQAKDTEGDNVIDRMPTFSTTNIQWAKDGRSFRGNGTTNRMGDVFGQFLGESIGVTFSAVIMAAAKEGEQNTPTSCSTTLSLLKGSSQLEGILRCPGIKPRFNISMGI